MYKPRTVEQPAELLSFLFSSWPLVKKKQVRTWLKHQAVMVNGRISSQFNQPLQPGDVVQIRNDRYAPPETVLACGIKVYFEDATLIVIDKPSNLLSIASEAEQEKTAYFQLTDYVRQGNPLAKERVWIVHRLDRETSGLMVFAKTAEAKETLQSNWESAQKRYFAVAEGHLKADSGVFASYLDETSPYRVFSVPQTETTRHAVTHYKVLKQGKGRTLVELTLETGRRHQIRVHLKDAGCPIVGDVKYGAKTDPAKRLGLHSCALKIKHPLTGRELSFESRLPAELVKLV